MAQRASANMAWRRHHGGAAKINSEK